MIKLVPCEPKYAELYQEWRSEPSTLKYNPVIRMTLEELRERMSTMSSDLANLESAEEFRFFVQCDGSLVGTVTLKNISHMMMCGEIGYNIGQNFQGRGLGTQAVRSFVAKVFEETPMRRLVAYVAEGNRPSRKLVEANGFQHEGLLREHFLINGMPTNEVVYGLLRSEWSKARRA